MPPPKDANPSQAVVIRYPTQCTKVAVLKNRFLAYGRVLPEADEAKRVVSVAGVVTCQVDGKTVRVQGHVVRQPFSWGFRKNPNERPRPGDEPGSTTQANRAQKGMWAIRFDLPHKAAGPYNLQVAGFKYDPAMGFALAGQDMQSGIVAKPPGAGGIVAFRYNAGARTPGMKLLDAGFGAPDPSDPQCGNYLAAYGVPTAPDTYITAVYVTINGTSVSSDPPDNEGGFWSATFPDLNVTAETKCTITAIGDSGLPTVLEDITLTPDC